MLWIIQMLSLSFFVFFSVVIVSVWITSCLTVRFISSLQYEKMSCTKIRTKKRISYDATHNSHRNVIDLFMLVEGNVLAYFCPIFPFGEVLCSYQLYVLECCTIEHTITNEKLFSLLYWKWVWLWNWCARHRQCGTHNRSGWIREYDWRRLCPQFCYFAFHRLAISCVCVSLTHSLCSLHKTIRPACPPASARAHFAVFVCILEVLPQSHQAI